MERGYNRTCKDCLTFDCCKKDRIPFFLTERELRKIEKKTGLSRNVFAEQINHESEHLWLLRRKAGHCIFFNESSPTYQKCKIYRIRPFDCRLFPLDVDLREGIYILIKYVICNGSNIPLRRQIEMAKKRILPFMKADLEGFATLPMELFEAGQWEEVGILNMKQS